MTTGVNFFGPSQTADGIGRAAALNLECFRQTGFDVKTFVLSRPVALEKGSKTVINDELIRSLEHKINYFHFSARWAPYYFAQLSPGALEGFYNIGYWVCEVPKIPDYWAKQLQFYDEIWTASSFCQEAIARSSNIPVVKIPHPIEAKDNTDRVIRRGLRKETDVFTYLSISNVYSDAERKNILFCIRAFLEVFGPDPSVRLVIKVSNLERDMGLAKRLEAIQNEHKNIQIITGYVEDTEIVDLFERTDVFLSLHRAEGFGFSIADAISRGIPVIVTGYSGNMDFCDAQDTILIKYDLVTVGHERLRYKKNDVWAEPDLQSAINAIAEIKTNYERHLELAQRARARVQLQFSTQAVTDLIRERTMLIQNKFDFKNDLDDRALDSDVGIKTTYGF